MVAPPPKAKPAKAKTAGYQVGKLYAISGGSIKAKNPSCPKCGPGFFMALHKSRTHCGKCGYTEMKGKA
ncbi:MAG: 30S ribosomal protein S27ae [Nanoarchaeota archaeon]